MNENKDYRPDDEQDEREQGAREDDFYGSSFREYASDEGEAQENRYTYDAILHDPTRPKSMGFSVASLVTGILSVLLCCTMYGALILGIVAIVLAVVSKKHLGYFDTMSLLGLIFGIFGLLFGIMLIVSVIWLSFDETWQAMLRELQESGELPPDTTGSL